MILEQSFQPYIPPGDQPQPQTPLPAQPVSLPPIEPAIQPLNWLWPGRIPQGKLTLLDGSPNCGTTLFALTLAAHVSTGRPWSDGTPCPQGNVLFLSPHDNFRDTLLPRLQAAGAQEGRVMTMSRVSDTASTDPHATRPFSLAHDLPFLEFLIRDTHILLLILDPYTAFPCWRRVLPALIELAQRTHCAIVLTRSLARVPSDLIHPHCPSSLVLTAARSHLLLVPDPRDERNCLLLTPKHSLCAAPDSLAYTITPTHEDLPTIQWLPAPDPAHLRRLATGPTRSPHRQAILHYLREQSSPCPVKAILAATSYDYETGRKMLLRMKMAGELVSLDRGLYTTANHPCLATLTSDTPSPLPTSPVPVPNVPAIPDQPPQTALPVVQRRDFPVPNVPAVPDQPPPSPEQTDTVRPSTNQSEAHTNPSQPSPVYLPPEGRSNPQTEVLKPRIAFGEEALARLQAHLAASGHPLPTISLINVPSPGPSQNEVAPIWWRRQMWNMLSPRRRV